MRLVIQRVSSAHIEIDEKVHTSIGRGLMVLVGLSKDDEVEDMKYCIRKLLGLKLFEDEEGKGWSRNVVDLGYEILLQSQFTLFANVKKGNKPDFHNAMAAEKSRDMYKQFVEEVQNAYNKDKVKSGVFQAYSQVHITNDGPTTIIIDSKNKQ